MSPREEAIARVRAALDRDSTCAWALAPESVAHLMAAYDEACKEREEYRAVIARQIEDKQRLRSERDEARQHHENALAIAAHNIERVKQLDAGNKAQFETLDALRGLHELLLAAVMDGTSEFREWQKCEADAIEGQEEEVERDHNRMLAALKELRRRTQHIQSGTRAVVEAGSLPAHLERAEQPKPADVAFSIEPRPWWVVFGLERHAASRMHVEAQSIGPVLVERSLRHLADDAHKRGVHPAEVARALDEARTELLGKTEGGS